MIEQEVEVGVEWNVVKDKGMAMTKIGSLAVLLVMRAHQSDKYAQKWVVYMASYWERSLNS